MSDEERKNRIPYESVDSMRVLRIGIEKRKSKRKKLNIEKKLIKRIKRIYSITYF